jgi:hypothetical protein
MTAHTPNQPACTPLSRKTCKLPPLILHPFSDPTGPNRIVASSRANLMMQGLLPSGESTRDDLDRTLLDGRYSEMRMLFYVGKDILRWIEQCMDCIRRNEGECSSEIQAQSFAALLIQETPEHIREKLGKWGVSDFKTIFSRGIGLNTLFSTAPDRATLSDQFVRNYYRYADQLFASFQSQNAYSQLDCAQWEFDIYSSGEYSRMLEREWAE